LTRNLTGPVFGDTTLPGRALAACKLRIPVAHVEADCVRSIVQCPKSTIGSHGSLLDLLFCPTRHGEQPPQGRHSELCSSGGDTMLDAVRAYASLADQHSRVLETLSLQERASILPQFIVPPHRHAREPRPRAAGARRLASVVVLPLHPRTKARIRSSPFKSRAM